MTTDDVPQHSEYGGAGAALEFALWSLNEQLQTIKDIDAKAERALTLAVAILALFSGASTFQLSGGSHQSWLVAAAALVVGIFLVAVVLFFRCQDFANLYLGPDGPRLLRVSADNADLRARQWMAEGIFWSVEANVERIETKDRRYRRLAAAVIAEAVSATVAIVVVASL